MHEMDYMNHVALYNDKLEWQISENGYVNLTIENKGIYNKIAQKLFRKPRYTNIELDCYGSRLWLYIDGKSTVYDIFMQMTYAFPDEKNMYERVNRFVAILQKNSFIKIA